MSVPDPGLFLGVGTGSCPPSPAFQAATTPVEAAPTENLLRWTEEFDNAVWQKTDVVVTPDQDGVADRAVFGTNGGGGGAMLQQVSETAATTGNPVALGIGPTTEYVRHSKSGTFDGVQYTASIEVKGESTAGVSLTLLRSGGFLAVQLVSQDDVDGRDILVKNAQLERGALTGYVHRTT